MNIKNTLATLKEGWTLSNLDEANKNLTKALQTLAALNPTTATE